MIEDLHRYIDLIHQRGQALFNAYNELRKHLMDIRRELSNLGRLNHAAEQTIVRLKTELEEWKVKSNKMTMELNELKQELEIDVHKVDTGNSTLKFRFSSILSRWTSTCSARGSRQALRMASLTSWSRLASRLLAVQ